MLGVISITLLCYFVHSVSTMFLMGCSQHYICTWCKRTALPAYLRDIVCCASFLPKHRLAHPENCLFSLSKNTFSGSKYPKIILFNFENRSTVACVLCVSCVLAHIYLFITPHTCHTDIYFIIDSYILD